MYALWVLACVSKPEEDSDSAPPIQTDDSDAPACEGADPVAVSLEISNGGLRDFDGTDWPTALISTEATDADGNLDSVLYEIWWDDDPDGVVDTGDDPGISQALTTSSGSCDGTEETIALLLQVGSGLSYDTVYDWATRVTDSSGAVSNVVTATAVTPKEDGSDGDG